jgi:WD40 repeat protein
MRVRLWIVAIFAASASATAAHGRSDGERPAVATSYDRDVRPIFRKRCANCHNPERPRGELDLTSYAGVLAGGAGGKAVVARAPEESPVYTLASHLEEPHMPPNAARIPQLEIDVLRRWIEGGLAENAGDTSTRPTDGAGDHSTLSPPGGLVSPVASVRAAAVTALAVSPSRPVVAVSGHKQILLYDLAGRKLLGALAFPEGDVFVLRFSGDARTLLAAGGIGAEVGKVVLFDTADWRRIATLGDELDAILAADLSPDGERVVLGGPSRLVKVLGRPRGEVVHTFRKPTDWVTAASISPDGLLVAAGDRFGGLFLWEARSGKEFLALRGHGKAITAIGWLAERDAMLTAGEDGRIEAWDLHTGRTTAGWDAHAGGALAIDLGRSGRIASAGRDRRVKIWDPGGRLVADLGPTADDATRVCWTADGRGLVSGDCAGELRIWSPERSSYVTLPTLASAKPATMAMVEPDLAPARPFIPRPLPTPTPERQTSDSAPSGDGLDLALSSARAAVAAAEKTVADLSRIARARSRAKQGPGQQEEARLSVLEALDAANHGLKSLRAALAADPDNASLKRAIREAEQAVGQLEERLGRDHPPSSGR